MGPSSNGLLGSLVDEIELELLLDDLEMYPVRQRGEALDRSTSDGPSEADMMLLKGSVYGYLS